MIWVTGTTQSLPEIFKIGGCHESLLLAVKSFHSYCFSEFQESIGVYDAILNTYSMNCLVLA